MWFVWYALIACNGVNDRAQVFHLSKPHIESPSGAYVAGKQVRDGKWTIEIQGRDGHRYEDVPGSLGQFKVYWSWDSNDRLWLYDSDDGSMRYWERAAASWERRVWDVAYGDAAQARYLCGLSDSSPTPAPPPDMFAFKVNASAQAKLAEKVGEPCKPPSWNY